MDLMKDNKFPLKNQLRYGLGIEKIMIINNAVNATSRMIANGLLKTKPFCFANFNRDNVKPATTQ